MTVAGAGRPTRLTLHAVGRLAHRSVVHDQTLVGAGGHVKAQPRGAAGGQPREPGVPLALEVNREPLAVGSTEPVRTLAPGRGRPSGSVRDGSGHLGGMSHTSQMSVYTGRYLCDKYVLS